MVNILGTTDPSVEAVRGMLDEFCLKHPDAQATTYRYGTASIRVRIVSESFATIDEVDRHDYVWPYIEALDEDVVEQITVVLLLTPKELAAGKSMMNIEFEDPSSLS